MDASNYSSTSRAPTVADLQRALTDLANGAIGLEGLRVLLRRSREMNGRVEHEALKAQALAGLFGKR